MNNNLVLKTYD